MVEQTLSKPKTIFLDPKSILKTLKIQGGQRVVDLGCGGGYFVIEAAREVGDNGLVYGVDVLQTALSALSSRARLYGLFNIRTVWSNAEVHGGAQVIKNGDIITVTYENGGVSLALQGKAMTAAATGDVVSVQNTLSKKIIQAVATGPGSAIVGPQAQSLQNRSSVRYAAR